MNKDVSNSICEGPVEIRETPLGVASKKLFKGGGSAEA